MRNGSDFNATSFMDQEHLKYLFMSPEGRINRQRIWLALLLLIAATIPVFIVAGILIFIGSVFTIIAVVLYIAAEIGLTIASIFLLIKRAHDRAHSGWYMLLTMIPLVGIIFQIELYFLRGTDGPNPYGADPR